MQRKNRKPPTVPTMHRAVRGKAAAAAALDPVARCSASQRSRWVRCSSASCRARSTLHRIQERLADEPFVTRLVLFSHFKQFCLRAGFQITLADSWESIQHTSTHSYSYSVYDSIAFVLAYDYLIYFKFGNQASIYEYSVYEYFIFIILT